MSQYFYWNITYQCYLSQIYCSNRVCYVTHCSPFLFLMARTQSSQYGSRVSRPTELSDVGPLGGQSISHLRPLLNQEGVVPMGYGNSLKVIRHNQIIVLNSKSDHKQPNLSFMFLTSPLSFHILFFAPLLQQCSVVLMHCVGD